MATFLFAWELGAGLGHLTNLRPLAGGLAERGHKVVLALRDLARARQVIADRSISVVQAPFRLNAADYDAEPSTFAQILAQVGFGRADELGTLVEAWRNLFETVRPDVIVFDHSPTALLAARTVRARRVLLGAGFFCPPDEAPLPNLRPWTAPDPARLARDEARVLAHINVVLSELGQPGLERVAQLYHPADENFLLTFAELDPYPARPASQYRGAPTNAGGAAVDWPAGPGPRVFAYLKPCAALVQVFDAFARLDARALVCTDGFGARLRERFATPRVRLLEHFVDLAQVAAECDLAVLNGNHGTSTAMLLAGKPTLQMPIYLEHALTMQAIVREGCGLGVSFTGSDPVGERMQSLLEDRKYADAARRFAQRYAHWNMHAQVAAMLDRLEQLAGQSN